MQRLADRPMSKSRLKRRGFPIHGYVGPNGHGKGVAMVLDTIPSLDSGRPVLSTVRLLDFRNPRPCPGGDLCDVPDQHVVTRRTATLVDGKVVFGEVPTDAVHKASHPFYVRLTNFGQLLEWRDGDVLLDEVTGVASSRDHASLPAPVVDLLVQLRRRNIALRWSTPNWSRADKVIREVTQAVTLCTGSFGKKRPQPVDEAPRLWTDRRFFTFRTYDAAMIEDWDQAQAENVTAEITQRIWRPGLVVNHAYDTLDPVTSLGYAVLGTCISCGGRRAQHKCLCGDGHTAAAKPEAAAAVGPLDPPRLSLASTH